MKGVFCLIKCSPENMPYVPESRSAFPEHTPLGMSYVPFQSWDTVYDENTAFPRGTIFPLLDFPFCGEEVHDND